MKSEREYLRPVVGVFAHPDDEAFGPSGTLAKMAKERDVYLICITDGAEGKNSLESSGTKKSLAEIRKEELLHSAQILGVKEVYFLGYEDGSLNNNVYHEVAEKIEEKLKVIEPETVMTFEPRGISGHIDHIATSMITHFVVKKSPFVKDIWMPVIIDSGESRDYFIYFPRGYKEEEVSKKVDVADVWDIKVEAMKAHESQRHDMKNVLASHEGKPKIEHFLIKTRKEL